jgi:dehydrogenase/reductase SDR family protein 7B
MTTLANKVVWVTGASGGIGEALARQAAEAGARLVLTARRESELERVRQACPDPSRVAVLPADLLVEDAEALAMRAEAFFGAIDVLVNNAGVTQRATVLETQMATYRHIFELDTFVPIALTKALLPGMVERRGGHVVTVSSVVGYISSPGRSGYAAAKHALHGFFDAARAEHHRDGVRFTLACPGFVNTDISRNALRGDGSAHATMDKGQANGLPPEVCAQRIWRAVRRRRAEVFIGRESLVIYLRNWFPPLYRALIARIS